MKRQPKKPVITLDECVSKYDPDEVLYIGGSEAFFWIGTAEAYWKEIDDVEKSMVEYMKNQIKKKQESIKSLQLQIASIKKNLEGFEPLRTRAVKDFYPAIDPKAPGMKILIKGRITGSKYWLQSEYERRHNAKKENV